MIEIVMICDDNYLVPTMTTVYSMFQTKKENTEYHINIIANSKSENLYDAIRAMSCNKFYIDIIFVHDERLMELAKNTTDLYCVATYSALLKFFIPEIVTDAKKVLYLDGDLIVKGDLTELYETDISEVFGAMVKDSCKLYSGRKIVNELDDYFNSGVMLLNLEKTKDIVNILIKEKQNQTDDVLMDQDVFNRVLTGKIINLPIKYNFLYTNLNRAKQHYSIAELNQLYGTKYQDLRDIYNDAVILHFSSKDKPWVCTDSPMARKWYACYAAMKRFLSKKYNSFFRKFEKNISDDKIKNAFELDKNGFSICEKSLIISLTSIPKRIDTLSNVIESLFNQSEIADKIILWLGESKFSLKERDLPESLLEYVQRGLEIRWCSDIKSHTKYYYTMRSYPEEIIVIVDDDYVYDSENLFSLYKSFLKFPKCISANRVHTISFDYKGEILPYLQWNQETEGCVLEPNMALIATGVGGVLYPPNSLYKDVFDIDKLDEICPTTDDLWLKMMSVMAGTKTVCAYPNINNKIIKVTQEVALYRINRAGGENDRQLRNLINYCELLDKNFLNILFEDFKKIREKIYKPVISVIIPVFHNQSNFRKTVESMLSQTLNEIEIFILDDGSKGNKVLNYKKENKVTVISGNKLLPGQAVNLAIEMARGDFIHISDSDTYYDPDFLKKLYARAKSENANIVLCNLDYFDSELHTWKTSEWEKKRYKLPAKASFKFEDIKEDKYSVLSYRTTDKIYMSEFLRQCNFKFTDEMCCYGDMIALYNAYFLGKISFLNESLGKRDWNARLYHSTKYNWKLIFESLLKMKDIFEGEDNKIDLLNFFLFVCIQEYSFATQGELNQRYLELQNHEFAELGLNDIDEEKVFDKDLFMRYKYILYTDFSWGVAKDCFINGGIDSERIRTLTNRISDLEQQLQMKQEYITNLEYLKYCLEETRKSKSYKIGMFITFIPRLLRKKSNSNRSKH